MVAFRCAQCSQPLRVDDKYAGRRARCPRCEKVTAVPAVAAVAAKQAVAAKAPRSSGYRPVPTMTGEEEPIPLSGYQILHELGRGPTGVVYEALQVWRGRVVALKMLVAGESLDADGREYFRQTAAEVAKLRHPNLAELFEAGDAPAGPYVSAEYVPGGTLAGHLQGRPQSPRTAASLGAKLARALAYVHASNLFHGNVKPSNVLLPAPLAAAAPVASPTVMLGRRGEPKLTDFRLLPARPAVGDVSTDPVQMTATTYLAPEQAHPRPQPVGPAADIHGLGVLLYEMLTGRPPFRGETTADTRKQIVEAKPIPPSQLQAAVPADLEAVVLKCLAKPVAARYPSAQALADDLDAFLDGRPVLVAARDARRGPKWAGRRRSWVALLLATFGLLLAGLGAGAAYYYANEAHRQTVELAVAAGRVRAATDNARLKTEEAQKATEQAADRRRSLIHVYVAAGNRLARGGDPLAALPWFAEALDPPPTDPAELEGQQLRFAAALDAGPRLVGFCPHANEVEDATLDPSGQTLLTRTRGGSNACLWTPVEGMLAVPPLRHPGRLRHAAFSPDGKTVVTAGDDGTARLWLAATGEAVGKPFQHPSAIRYVAFRADGNRLAATGDDGTVSVWNLGGERREPLTIALNAKGVFVGFSRDGKRLLTADESGTARVWDADTGKPVGEPLAHQARADGRPDLYPSFSPDSTRVLTVAGAAVRVSDTGTGKTICTLAASGDPGPVHWAIFSPDGLGVLTAAGGPTAGLWDADEGEVKQRFHVGQAANRGCFRPDGRRVALATDDEVSFWDTETGQSVGVRLPHGHALTSLAFAADGRHLLLLTAGRDGVARVWNLDDRPAEEAGAPAPTGDGLRHAFSPDGRWELRFGKGRGAQLVERANGKPTGPVLLADEEVRLGQFSPDGKHVFAASDGKAVVAHFSDDRQLTETPLTTGGAVEAVAFAADGSRLATIGADRAVRIWDAQTGQAVGTPVLLPLKGPVAEVLLGPGGRRLTMPVPAALSPDGQMLLTAGEDGIIRAWETATGRPAGAPLRTSPARPLRSVAFRPDGRQVVTADADGRVCLWDMKAREWLAEVPGTSGVRPVQAWFSGEGGQVLTTGPSRPPRSWPLPTARVGAEQLPALARLLTATRIDPDTGRAEPVAWGEFIDQRGSYQALWLAYAGKAAPGGPERLLSPADGPAGTLVPATEAGQWVGERCTVEMTVHGTGQTQGLFFLNSLANFRAPDCFTIVVPDSELPRFEALGIKDPQSELLNRRVRVTGTVAIFRDRPQIKVSDLRAQLEVLPDKPE